jgi:hypothetical protein
MLPLCVLSELNVLGFLNFINSGEESEDENINRIVIFFPPQEIQQNVSGLWKNQIMGLNFQKLIWNSEVQGKSMESDKVEFQNSKLQT